ncbi:MAG: hypothetical protein KGH61_02270 [Candidatus Micrarchaeota archaeon]|nr:hypothetical protein [Candidatus Micrarchaeota archaeon]MDE1847754.1 hypothetical protein [Candidatus Micrarchaeota archaeon]MDE1863897.1 hypothetical protein [Candidatus Micrarchaeota archaeon]
MANFFSEHKLYSKEIQDLLLADVILTLAFTLVIVGGTATISAAPGVFLYFLPISFIAVSLTFVLHELMHKFVAQHYGAVAAFRTSMVGLLITIASSFFGFLIGIPGATVIYASTFTAEHEGKVSLAGPLTNFVVFGVFFTAGLLSFHGFPGNILSSLDMATFQHNPYIQNLVDVVLFISILLAFYNMLPIYPLDGSKVLRWNKGIYVITVAIIFALFLFVIPLVSLLISLVFMLFLALMFSLLYRGIRLF